MVLTRDDAQSGCESNNLTLAVPRTSEEFAALRTFLDDQSVTGSEPRGYQQAWIGLERWGGMSLWLDETEFAEIDRWAPGQPSYDGNCVSIMNDTGIHWMLNDIGCDLFKLSSVCQPRRKYSIHATILSLISRESSVLFRDLIGERCV